MRLPHAPTRLPRTRPAALLLISILPLAAGCPSHSTDESGAALPTKNLFGHLGESPGNYACPRAIDTDGALLWIADRSGRFQAIDPADGSCRAWFTMPEYLRGKPVGFSIAPGPDTRPALYIADTHYSQVLVVRPPAIPERSADPVKESPLDLIAKFGTYGAGDGQFIYPTDIAVSLRPGTSIVDRIYVSEYGGNDRVSVFDSTYRFQFSFGTYGTGENPAAAEFCRPQSITLMKVGDATELIITDARNHRLGRFTPEGKLIGWIGSAQSPGRALGRFNMPYGLEPLNDGTVLVTEYGNNRLQRVDIRTGAGLEAWGRPGREKGELAIPWGLTILNDQTYVLDTGNNRVQSFRGPHKALR